MQDQDVEVVGGDANGDHRSLHLAAQASVGWPHRPHADGSPPTQIPHLLDSTAKAAWTSSVYLRALTEQDAQAGRHPRGVRGVVGASAGSQALEGSHLQHRQIPPGDTARRKLNHTPLTHNTRMRIALALISFLFCLFVGCGWILMSPAPLVRALDEY